MKKFFVLIVIGVILVGCATIISGTRQSVIFAAPEGTKIYREGIKVAEIPQGKTSVSTLLERNISGSYFVAKKEGYHDARFYVQMKVNGVVFVNILVGAVWAAVDLATGAAAKYPSYIEVEMEPITRGQKYQREATNTDSNFKIQQNDTEVEEVELDL